MEKVERKITCQKCFLMKYHNLFTMEELESDAPVCKNCRRGSAAEKQNGLKIEYKWRNCLKCDKRFKAPNGYRLCYRCHENMKDKY